MFENERRAAVAAAPRRAVLETRAIHAEPPLFRNVERVTQAFPHEPWIDTVFDHLGRRLVPGRQHLGADNPLRPLAAELIFN